MKLLFTDLAAQYQHLKKTIDARIQRVLDHGQFILGPEVEELEEKLAEYVGVKYAVGVSDGTTALQIALMALGIGQEDEVITTAFTFISTAETIVLLGAKPVFVDIDATTYNINPSLIESAITPKTKAIMAVNLYGQCADFDAIHQIAKKYALPIIEDAAQSFGAQYKGKKSGALATIGCTSFYPAKPLGCYGDGGMCFTDDQQLAQTMKEIRIHGQSKRYYHTRLGLNGRLDTLQAAIVLAKLPTFDEEIQRRQKWAQRYDEALKACVQIPKIQEGLLSVYGQYTIGTCQRDALQARLKEQGIPTVVHYPIALHQQPALSEASPSSFIEAEKAARTVLSLPLHAFLKKADQDRVIEAIKEACQALQKF